MNIEIEQHKHSFSIDGEHLKVMRQLCKHTKEDLSQIELYIKKNVLGEIAWLIHCIVNENSKESLDKVFKFDLGCTVSRPMTNEERDELSQFDYK